MGETQATGEDTVKASGSVPIPALATYLYGEPIMLDRVTFDRFEAMPIVAEQVDPVGFGFFSLFDEDEPSFEVVDRVGVIRIHGALTARARWGVSNYEAISRAITAALSSSRVDGIMLDVDSPGGQVAGVFELAAAIRTASQVKPVWAHATNALSAGYALASAAARMSVSMTGAVGSIGVVYKHVDRTGQNEQMGIKVTPIFAGDRKLDLDPDVPLSEQARSDAEAEILRIYGIFANAVAKHRGISVDAVMSTQARVYYGEGGIEAGLVDAVSSIGEAIALMNETLGASGDASSNQTRAASDRAPEDASMSETTTTDAEASEAASAGTGADVTSIDAARGAGVEQGREEVQQVVEMCSIAGRPELAAEFVAEKLSPDAVRARLLELGAQRSERSGEIDTTHTNGSDADEQGGIPANALVARAKRVHGLS